MTTTQAPIQNHPASAAPAAPYHGKRPSERIAHYGWNSNGIFLVTASLEWRETFWKDVVILEVREGVTANGRRSYSKETGIRMLGDATDLRALAHAIRGLVSHRQSTFKKFTDPSRAKQGAGGGKEKMLTLGYANGKFYVNMSQHKKIGVFYDAFTMLAMADQLQHIAECLELALFRRQYAA